MNPDEIGRHVLDAQLKRGFTVIRYGSDGRTDFGLGFIPKGQKPYKPFEITSEKRVLVNERTEVHLQAQDYIGPLSVTDDDSALYLTLELDGAESVDYQLVPKALGDAMLDRYVRTPGPCPDARHRRRSTATRRHAARAPSSRCRCRWGNTSWCWITRARSAARSPRPAPPATTPRASTTRLVGSAERHAARAAGAR